MEERTCSVDGCNRSHYVRQWCSSHYQRWLAHGDPQGGGPERLPAGTTMKWLSDMLASADPSTCWEWPFALDRRGYGKVWYGGKIVAAHRVAAELVGLDLSAPLLRHRCDNRTCVNPAHLEPGTPADNSRDMVIRERSTKGARNPQARLSESNVREIRALLDTCSQRAIADRYGVNPGTISAIARRETWGWLT